MNGATAWIAKTEAQPGESLASYLRHFARDNFFASRRELLRALNVSGAIRLDSSEVLRLGNLLGVPHQVMNQMAPSDTPPVPALRRALTRAQGEAVCTECLRQHSYSRRHWSHHLVTACSEHRVQLIEHCPACGTQLQYDRPLAHYCDCGHDLRNTKAAAAAPYEVEIACLLDGRTPIAPALPLDLSCGVPADIDLFLLGLVNYFGFEGADVKPATYPGLAPAPRSVNHARERLAVIGRMTQDWPDGFSEIISGLVRAPSRRSSGSVAVRLGSWYAFLFRRFRHPAYGAFRTVAANGIVLTHSGPIDARSRDLLSACTVERADWVTVAEAARSLGVDGARMAKGVEDGRIPGFVPGAGYRQRSITRQELERLRAIRDDHCDKAAAAACLGIPASVFSVLEEAGLIHISDAATLPPVTRGYVNRSELQKLADRLLANLNQLNGPFIEHIAFRQLNLRRTTHRQRLIDLCRSIHDGSFPAVGHDGTGLVGGILFSKRNVQERIASFSVAIQLNAQQISHLTGVHYGAVKAWMRSGILPVCGKNTRTDPLRVELSDLIRFLLEYSPLSCLAAQVVGSSSQGIERLLARRNVFLVDQSDNRGLLVRITDIIRTQ